MSKAIFLFPGQGSHYTGMGRAWFDEHSSVRDRFAEASEIAGFSLANVCFDAPPEELTQTGRAQISLLVLGYAMFEVLEVERLTPVSFMAGHSLGELTALTAAGALSFGDAVRLVKVRGEAMDVCAKQKDTGMIAALAKPTADIERLVHAYNTAQGGNLQIANYNGAAQTVLAGTQEELAEGSRLLQENGCQVLPLNVAGAFHSSYMAEAVPRYVDAIRSTSFRAPRVPVYSTVTGALYRGADDIPNTLAVQLTSPVRWHTVVTELMRHDPAVWVEVGPKQVLSRMVADITGGARALALDVDPDGARDALRSLVESDNLPGLVGLCLGAAAATRNRNFDDLAYEAGVIEPYRSLTEMSRAADEIEASDARKQEALLLLRKILDTKGVPLDEQADRIDSILRRTGNLHLGGHVDVVAP